MLDRIRWLASFYRGFAWVLFVLIVFTPIQAMLQVLIPRLFGYALNYAERGTFNEDFLSGLVVSLGERLGISTYATFGVAFIMVGLISSSLYAFVQGHRAWMNNRLEWLFRQRIFDSITGKGPNFFNEFRTGDLVTRMTDDVAENMKLAWFTCSGTFRLYEASLAIVFITFMMLTIDPWLTLWTAGPLPLLIFIFFKSSGAMERRYEHLQERISLFNDVMEACFSGVRVVKAYVREKAQIKSFDDAADERRHAEVSAVRLVAVIQSLYQYIWQFAVVIVLVAGGYLVLGQSLTVGDLGTFVFYTVWLIFPMFDIGEFLVKWKQSVVYVDRLTQIEHFPAMVEETKEEIVPLDGSAGLSFNDISFHFPDSEREIIDKMSLTIEPGQTIALVGKVGAGKTWLINMLPRLIDPTGGRIELDGHDLRKFSLEDLRRNIGYVPQEPILFSDTVRNNILFGRDDISDTVIEWAVDVAQLKSEIDTFPDGMNTMIGTRGMTISGGQKQRLALARALVGKPKILILDDCTSALDSRTEAALWDRLHDVMPDMTAILITHRPSTLELVDNIFVLEGGRLIDNGTHDELMAREGDYARIYKRYQLEEQIGDRAS